MSVTEATPSTNIFIGMKKENIIYGVICAIVGAIVTLAVCVLAYHPTPVTESVREVVRTDTVTTVQTVHDTVEVTKLRPIYTEVIRHDTIPADTVIPVERMTYDVDINNDSITGTVRAVISGVNPCLDSLTYRFQIPTKTITERIEVEKIIRQKTHISYGVGVMAGYGFFSKRPEIVGGVYIGYSF